MINQPKNQSAKIVTQIPGPKSSAVRQQEDKNLAPGLQGFALMSGVVVDHASGNTVTDLDGNTFIDIIGGIGVNGLGHSHPVYVKAIQDQVQKASVGSFTSEARVKLLDLLAANPPAPGVHRAQLYSSGAEAVESALRLAKCYTGKYEFLSFWGGFHGKTMGVLSLMGSTFKEKLGPMVSGSHMAPYANCYRCPFKTTYPGCSMQCLDFVREQVKLTTAGSLAAIIVEPMQGTAGNIIPPKEFVSGLKEIAKENNALLICDEMITGFGRTGKYWGCNQSGTQPDIVTMGKQFGGGFPISAVMSRDEIVNSKPWSVPSGSSSSYGGNPLASAAAAAAVGIINNEGLVENSRRQGEYFLGKLRKLEAKYGFIGEVRGCGLFMGVEMVKDRKTKEPMSKQACNRVFMECLKRGLLTMAYAPSFRIQPSLTIDEGTIDNAVAILDEVFSVIDREAVWKA
jgi:4-aminobutyrate aminotransferase-like enzyme